jgi:tRNA modification GTPase
MVKDRSTEDTITAIATPVGQAGIGIIRISGSRAAQIAERIFQPKRPVQDLQTHRLHLGHIIDPASGRVIDEVLLSLMKAPQSYTREDVVEINSHSGYLLLSRILRIVLDEGARLARPGEFTYRAFMNGRIDLTQAEAVVDLINSRSERGLELAARQIRGTLRGKIEALRQRVLDILAHVEVAVDFPEEESALLPREATLKRMEGELLQPIEKILAAHAQRKIWVDGINTVIVGRVNAGKSSLLNRLINEKRAIVTSVPGTTRDIIESTVSIEGIPLRLMDTAGFRKVKGRIERIGIRLTEQKLAEADLSLTVLDQSRPLNQDDLDLIARSDRKKGLILVNKIDLPPRVDRDVLLEAVKGRPLVRISALKGDGIDELRKAIRDLVMEGETAVTSETHVVPNLRHKDALMEASQAFSKAMTNLREDLPLDIVAMDLTSGLEALGEIIGETPHEEILERIFSQFCLGK